MKTRLLCILHRSPPFHGAAKVGDFIASSNKLQDKFNCKFITIKSSDTIEDIGRINLKKFYFVFSLYFKILLTIIIFKPNKIYFTSSVKGVAFYRDLLFSTIWKAYGFVKNVDVYYHYHTKGVGEFVANSKLKLFLTKFFVKNINIILLSPMLRYDFSDITTYKKMFFLPNGVEDPFLQEDFNKYLRKKFDLPIDNINVLYLSNMIKAKGYFEVLKLAKKCKKKSIYFCFAGNWQNKKDEENFFDYIKENNLENTVYFYGFVNGEQKNELLKKANLFIFPTRYKNEAFPLSILEAFSYGIPVISTNEGSISSIIDYKSGLIADSFGELQNILELAIDKYLNFETSMYCRKRYVNKFSLGKFEENLLEVLK